MAGEIYANLVSKGGPQNALSQHMNFKKAFMDAQRLMQYEAMKEQRKQRFDEQQKELDRQNTLRVATIGQGEYNLDWLDNPASMAGGTPQPTPSSSTIPMPTSEAMKDPNAAMSLATGGVGDLYGNQLMSQESLMSQSTEKAQTGWHKTTKSKSYQLSPEEANSLGQQLVSGKLVPSQLSRIQKSQALISAQEIDPTYNASKADIEFAVNKTGASNFEKLYNNVTSFEKTFRKNADVALKLSESFPRSKLPLINRAIMAGKLNITGDPEASKMVTSLYTVATEYARLTSAPGATGTMITDSARDEARNMLSVWMNQGTIRGQLDPITGIMSIDAKNRIDALDEKRNEIKDQYSGQSNKQDSRQKLNITKDNLFEGL